MSNPDELLAAVRAAQSAVAQAGDAGYGDVPRRDLPEVVRCADRLAQAAGALDEYQMGGGPPPADWQRTEPTPDQVARYIAHHGIPAVTQPGAGSGAEEAAKVREFIQALAQNSIVAADFTEGNEAFNEVIQAARALAAELGITYQPGEGPAEDDQYEAARRSDAICLPTGDYDDQA